MFIYRCLCISVSIYIYMYIYIYTYVWVCASKRISFAAAIGFKTDLRRINTFSNSKKGVMKAAHVPRDLYLSQAMCA